MKIKMNLIMSIVIVVILNLAALNIVFSTCPNPNDQQTFVTVFVNGCEYEVEICYHCAGTTPYGHIHVFSFREVDPNCNQTWNDADIYEGICAQVYTYNFLKTFICLGENVAPCEPDDGGVYYMYYKEICWQKVRLPDDTIFWFTCNLTDTYCAALFKMCFDPTLPYPHVRVTQTEPYHISGDYEGRCQGEEEPEDPILIGIPTGCFELHTPCNP